MIIKILFSEKADKDFLQKNMLHFAAQGYSLNLLKPDDADKDTCRMDVMRGLFGTGTFVANNETPDSAKEMIIQKIEYKLWNYFLGILKREGIALNRTDFAHIKVTFEDNIPDIDENGRAFYWHQASDTLLNQ